MFFIVLFFCFFFFFVAWWHNKKLADSVHSRRVALRRVCQRAEQSKSRGAAQSSAASDKSQSQNLATLRPGQRHTDTQRRRQQAGPQNVAAIEYASNTNTNKAIAKKNNRNNRRRRRGSSSSEKSEVSIKAHTGQNSFQPVPGSLV